MQDLLNRVLLSSYNVNEEFELEACRSLIALGDANNNGRLTYHEFLSKYIQPYFQIISECFMRGCNLKPPQIQFFFNYR